MRYYEEDKDTVVIKFYGEVSVWYISAQYFTNLFEDLDSKYKNIKIRMHSYGGHVFEGNVIYNAIKAAKSVVTVYIDGVSASMASIVMLAASKVVAADNAFVMLHCPSGYTEGNANQHYQTAKLLRSMEANFGKRYSEKTGKPAKEVQSWFDGADHWFSADEALATGLIDEVVPAVVGNIKDLSKPESKVDVSVLFNRYTALVKDLPTSSQNQNKNEMNKQELIDKFKLEGVTAESSDTAIMDAMAKKMGETNTPKSDEPSAQAESVIAAVEAATGKSFEAEQRKTLLAIGANAGLKVLADSMKMLQPQPPQGAQSAAAPASVSAVIVPAGAPAASTTISADRKDWGWNKWQEEDPRGLEEMKTSNFDAFSALYKREYKEDFPKD